jgi:Short repeat of unknown function (DUF308)
MNRNEPSDARNAAEAGRSPSPTISTSMASTGATGDAASNDAMCALLAQNWWAVALRGVFAILFGLVALFLTGPTILSLVLFFSAYMLVDGVFGIIAAVRAARQANDGCCSSSKASSTSLSA